MIKRENGGKEVDSSILDFQMILILSTEENVVRTIINHKWVKKEESEVTVIFCT